MNEMKEESLIRDMTKIKQSTWRENIENNAAELHLKDVLPITNKNNLKCLIQEEEISTKILDNIEAKTENKTKVKHWKIKGKKHKDWKKTDLHGQTKKKTMQCHN